MLFRSFDTAEDMKRILVGNMIILADLMNGVALDRFGIMETMRLAQKLPVMDGCILRTAANIQLDEESILLYEVVRPQGLQRRAGSASQSPGNHRRMLLGGHRNPRRTPGHL